MGKIKVLIVDDEALGRSRIMDLLPGNKSIEEIREAEDVPSAIDYIHTFQPDILFLDIHLGTTSGFDLLEQITEEEFPLTIFVTAFDEYALKAFDYSAVDYLLKPFTNERFYKALNSAFSQLETRDALEQQKKFSDILTFIRSKGLDTGLRNNKLAIKVGNKTNFIDKNDIKYILASGYYVEIYANEKKHVLRSSLSNMLEVLNNEKFVRIHRSTVVNLEEVTEVIHSDYGEVDVKLSDQRLFRLSKSYKKQFFDLVGL